MKSVRPKSPLRWLLALLVVAAVALAVYLVARVALWPDTGQSSFAEAEAAFKQQRWADARRNLDEYFRHTADAGKAEARVAEAHMMMAEAHVKDPEFSNLEAIGRAIDHLRKVPDDSPLAAQARFREAELSFLILYRPARAERLLRTAIRLEPDLKEAHVLLWKVLDMTNRADLSEPSFWRVYELSPPGERIRVLREWYLSQFSPGSANAKLDRELGVLGPAEMPGHKTEFDRLLKFRGHEPQSPIVHASMANWFRRQKDPKYALKLLREASSLPGAMREPTFVGCLVATYLDLGEFEMAEQFLAQWPEPRAGYEYWNLQGTIEHKLNGDHAAAAAAYEKALAVWPGPFISTTRFRLAQCLERLGNAERAAAMRQAAQKLQPLMQRDHQRQLREALLHVDQPDSPRRAESIRKMSEFYRQINRPREAECWIEAAGDLPG